MNGKTSTSKLFTLIRGEGEPRKRSGKRNTPSRGATSPGALAYRSLGEGHRSYDKSLESPKRLSGSRKERMLLVEDSDDDALFVTRAVSRGGYGLDIDRAATGAEAKSILDSGCPCLIVLDCRLPDISGLEVLMAIRKEKRFCRVPVVMMSDTERDEDIQLAFRLGANSFVRKPVSPDGYTTAMETILSYWLGLNYCGLATRHPEVTRQDQFVHQI